MANPDKEKMLAGSMQGVYFYLGLAGVTLVCILVKYSCLTIMAEELALKLRMESFKALLRLPMVRCSLASCSCFLTLLLSFVSLSRGSTLLITLLVC